MTLNIQPFSDSTLETICLGNFDSALADLKATKQPVPGVTLEKLASAEQKPDPMESTFAEWSEIAITGRATPVPRLRSEHQESDPDKWHVGDDPDKGLALNK